MKKITALVLTAVMVCFSLCGCAKAPQPQQQTTLGQPISSMQTKYAEHFAVDYYEGGYKLISISDGSKFLIVPEDAQAPENLDENTVVLKQPIENIYLAASAAMCLFDALEKIDTITLSGTKQENWYIENARKAMEQGKILYAGKYSEPDYELLLEKNCPIAIESLMIGQASEVKNKLEEIGIAVFVDQSSIESHPLGRMEWIKVYAAMLNEEEKAEEIFNRQADFFKQAEEKGNSGSKVAFFHVNSSGEAVVRKGTDYIAKMLEIAGGEYLFKHIGDPEKRTSTEKVEWEEFFATAKEADYIIYNSAIGGEIETIEQLVEKNSLLADLKAVQNGNVWCTGKNMYQESTHLGEMVDSFQKIFSGEADEMTELPFLHKLK